MPSAVISTDEGADALTAALEPELRRNLPRTEITVSVSDGRMTARISAEDTASLRAAVNSTLECITVVRRIDNIAKGTQ